MMFGTLLNYLKVVNELGVNRSIRPSAIQMATWNDTRSDLLQKVLLKKTALTTEKPFHRSLRRTLLELLWHWWLIMI